LNQKKAGLPGWRTAMGDIGHTPEFLKQFHYSDFGGHKFKSRKSNRRSCAT